MVLVVFGLGKLVKVRMGSGVDVLEIFLSKVIFWVLMKRIW